MVKEYIFFFKILWKPNHFIDTVWIQWPLQVNLRVTTFLRDYFNIKASLFVFIKTTFSHEQASLIIQYWNGSPIKMS